MKRNTIARVLITAFILGVVWMAAEALEIVDWVDWLPLG